VAVVGVATGCVGIAVGVGSIGDGLGVDFGVGVVSCRAIMICGVAVGNWSAFILLESSVCGGTDERPCCGPQALKRTIVSTPSKIESFLPTTVHFLLEDNAIQNA
jgi:hypothetical protein